MTQAFDSSPYEHEMWESVGAVAAKRIELEEVKQQLEEAKTAAAEKLRRYGAALNLDGLPVPRQTVRSLYWENRDIPADAIAKAFALPGGAPQVYKHAGEAGIDLPCPGGCGRSVHLSARTAALKRCDVCQTAWQQNSDAMWAENSRLRELKRAEQEAYIRQQLMDGQTPEEIYLDTFADPRDGTIDRIRILDAEVNGLKQPF